MMKSKLLVAIITFVVLATMVAGCGGSPEIGDVVSGDIWQAKVISVESEKTLAAVEGSWSPEEGFSFLVVGVQVNNISTATQEFNWGSPTLTDIEQRIYTPVGIADDVIKLTYKEGGVGWMAIYYDLVVTWWTITASAGGGISDETPPQYIVFLVPDDAEGFYFKLMDLPEIYLGQ